jgi:hypothetical protein
VIENKSNSKRPCAAGPIFERFLKKKSPAMIAGHFLDAL